MVELLNLNPAQPGALDRFFNRQSHLLPAHLQELRRVGRAVQLSLPTPERLEMTREDAIKENWVAPVLALRRHVAEAWCKPTTFDRQLALTQILARYAYPLDKGYFELLFRMIAGPGGVQFPTSQPPPDAPINEHQEHDGSLDRFIDNLVRAATECTLQTASGADWGDPFTILIVWAMQFSDRMRRCLNPECPAPYFIAARRKQKYCGDDCAVVGKRESKRNWWNEKGEKWRAARAKKQRVKKGKKGGKR